MTENWERAQAEPAEPGAFRVVLTPYRSLGPTGFIVLMAALGAVSFVTGIAFLMMGAWPVLGFFGLDVALVYVAFKLNYRSGRLYETLELTPAKLTWIARAPFGKARAVRLQPLLGAGCLARMARRAHGPQAHRPGQGIDLRPLPQR